MIHAESALEAIGVERRLPDEPFLGVIFAAFNARVPFESASKILRKHNFETREPAQLLLGAESFWEGFRERGSGGTCFARVEAFAALAQAVGFFPRRILGSVEKPGDHAALVIEAGGKPRLVDVGFPLPGVLPLEPHEGALPVAEYRLEREEGRARFEYLSGPRAGKCVLFDLGEVSPETFRERWRSSFAGPSKFLENVVLLRQEPHRAVRFFRGVVSLDDAHTRTRIPLFGNRASKLEELFEISQDLLRGAFAVVGDPEPEAPLARIDAFRPTPRAAELLGLLSSPEGYLRYLRGLGESRVTTSGPDRFSVALRGHDGAEIVEEVTLRRAERCVETRRETGLRKTGFRMEEAHGVARLVRYAELPDAREEFLRGDLGRGRIAGLLAMDLLALSRLLED